MECHISDMGKFLSIGTERRKKRIDFTAVKTQRIFILPRCKCRRRRIYKSFFCKSRNYILHKAFMLLTDNLMSTRRDLSKLHFRRKSRYITTLRICGKKTFYRRDTHLKKFIKITRHNCKKLKPFYQRLFFIQCKMKNSRIKFYP